jgi:uncharacterized protein YceK
MTMVRPGRSPWYGIAASVLSAVAVVVLLSGCGSSTKTATGPPPKSAAELRASAAALNFEAHKSQACIAVIGAFTHINISPTGQSVASIARTKESLHELAQYSPATDRYTVERMSEVFSRLEAAIEAYSAGNYAEANGKLTGLNEETKELKPKVLAICSRPGTSSTPTTPEATVPSTTAVAEGNVPAAAAALAHICVGQGNSAETQAKVKALVDAYRHDASREADRHYLVVAEENLEQGCGSQYVHEVREVLGK